MNIQSLLRNVRFYVLCVSFLLSVFIYLILSFLYSSSLLQLIRLEQVYALTALAYLYIVLLIGPLCYRFNFLPFQNHYLKARRALGVSVFYFGLLHGTIAFFGQLGGFSGLRFLSNNFLIGITLSFTALLILSAMAATSFDAIIAKMTYPKWKILHRFVYLAGILILIHGLLLGTHFQNLSDTIPQISFFLLTFLLYLEADRFDAFLQRKFSILPRFGLTVLVFWIAVGSLISYSFIPNNNSPLSLGIHAQHILLAQQAQQAASNPNAGVPQNLQNIPGLRGDRTKRFTVSFLHDNTIAANQDMTLTFQVFDASSGNKINFFQAVYEKPLHLIIVDSQLQYFTHIHPTLTDNGFTITTQFPHDGVYHLYLDFQPFGAIEQQFAFTVTVGNSDNPLFANQKPDTTLTKSFNDYEVSLAFPKPLKTPALSVGQQTLTFTIKDAKTKKPITTLKPYLAAFGHLVMINEKTYDYLHVHPTNLVAPPPTANGGPTVEFLPLGLYGPITPGIYRIFAQFNPDNKLFTADFTITIE